jgi:hypothetical protein
VNKVYTKRLEEGKHLIKNYRASKFYLGKYALEMIDQFPGLTLKRLSQDLKLPYGTMKPIVAYYRKSRETFSEDKQERGFFLIQKLVCAHKLKISELNSSNLVMLEKKLEDNNIPKGFAAFGKFKSYSNQLISFLSKNPLIVESEKKEIYEILRKMEMALEGKLKKIA